MKNSWSIEKLQTAWTKAAQLHEGQKYGGAKQGEKVEYLAHIGRVTFEVLQVLTLETHDKADIAIQCAILHDTIEDTNFSYELVNQSFGEEVANGVLALTKDKTLPTKQAQMLDSLQRIKAQPKAVWLVKMADRIANLNAPPYYWTVEKMKNYQAEAQLIYQYLQEASPYLAQRLWQKIENYQQFFPKQQD